MSQRWQLASCLIETWISWRVLMAKEKGEASLLYRDSPGIDHTSMFGSKRTLRVTISDVG